MATGAEILEALADYQVQCNENKRLRRMQRDWSRLLHFVADDTGDIFTMDVIQGEIVSYAAGAAGTPDIIVTTASENLCDMFWGDLNPSQKYLQGEIRVKATQEDIVRLDAITMIIWPDV
ncbi:MAG: SCP2 sterol-binding domain-containing protein [Syntrophales bacterium]|jgi:putative sterol carrier protein|nr:SCP2 sterol-binding domain-containing protein [Syntrophales bacterium]MDD4340150.1 SCP2 sterol-binding domain-containing protein [Syntrophales bacterium]HOG07391.1 SCP2 sterol-binding domain-containing protein [Syntrophales bacterium]HPB71017.1 SCP2 sterol-binding domain-containing protein [Syntrophales bacterium]HQN26519.1 SCP2 sterol-binding domain-containing protein [Syntrophales bacterium]